MNMANEAVSKQRAKDRSKKKGKKERRVTMEEDILKFAEQEMMARGEL